MSPPICASSEGLSLERQLVLNPLDPNRLEAIHQIHSSSPSFDILVNDFDDLEDGSVSNGLLISFSRHLSTFQEDVDGRTPELQNMDKILQRHGFVLGADNAKDSDGPTYFLYVNPSSPADLDMDSTVVQELKALTEITSIEPLTVLARQ